MARYWVYIDSKIQGPVEVPALRRVAGFNLLSQVCMEGEQTWSLADDILEIKSYFLAPPRASSLQMEFGNTAVKVEAEAPPIRNDASPLSILSMDQNLVEELPPLDGKAPPVKKDAPGGTAAAEGKPNALRALCDVCGYKNPRDVTLCLKCGAPVGAAPATVEKPTVDVPLPAAAAPASTGEDEPHTQILEHKILPPSPMRNILIGVAVAAVALTGVFGIRSWKKHHPKKAPAIPLVRMPPPMDVPTPRARKSYSRSNRHASSSGEMPEARHLPGVTPHKQKSTEEPETPSAYHVISEATPLKHRTSSPLDSPYAQKRRSDKSLWNAQQEQAIRQVQKTRIYGAQRTLQRNVEILMQLLRDREYNTAFETGRRPYLYNDLDWSASLLDGPIYDVRLAFSGGREEDGSPRKPLRFAFKADLERGTTEPGGEESLRNNTMHAFFDESRIPPEERRPIAKDVEELVLAADPTASPLALDTVVRNFVATYNLAALERVARAFDLDTVKKKIKHDPNLGKALAKDGSGDKSGTPAIFEQMDRLSPPKARVTGTSDVPTPVEMQTPRTMSIPETIVNGEFAMEHGSKHDRIIQARVTTKATPDRLWEALTGYERFKLFVPDVLESEREGQDGSAIIVHTVSLSHWMFLVFKINLHLRVIERPAQRVIEFERIAGDFETFRGSFEIQSDPTTKRSAIVFHSTLAPKGKMPDWMLSAIAKRFILPKLAAFAARAEAN
jgi:ribosome-associated toxin RatA of RatAB toxin-antitoxin module